MPVYTRFSKLQHEKKKMIMRWKLIIFWIVAICALNSIAVCEAEEKPPFDPSTAQDSGLPLPNPYDKLLAAEQILEAQNQKPNWSEIYSASAKDIDANQLSSRESLALALGVKIADGIVAVKAQDINALNQCADQIEALAKKLGAKPEDLERARMVRENANKGKWLSVFMELGFLQADVMKILAREGNKTERSLIVAAGWMQGARHVTYLISQFYSPELSNILREPVLVKAVISELDSLPKETRSLPQVHSLISAFYKTLPFVSINNDESVSLEAVQNLREIASTAISSILN